MWFNTNECIGSLNPNVCDILKGWKIRNDHLIPGNGIPEGVQLILVKELDILMETGGITLSYDIISLQNEEYFYVEVDGVAQSKKRLDI
jgi:hypothetical protein